MTQTGRAKARAACELAQRRNQTPKPKPHQAFEIKPRDSATRPAAQRPSIKPFEQNPDSPWRGKSPAVAATHTKGGANGRGAVAPVRIRRADPSRVEIIVPPHVKVQRGPSYTHDSRIQCAPGAQPFGAGFAAAGPGVDIETGKGWGK